MKVIVYDDDPGRSEAWVERLWNVEQIGKDHSLKALSTEEFRQALDGLSQRRESARSGEVSNDPSGSNPLDDVDVLVLDYDLYELGRALGAPHRRVTGEEMAYLIRCFSSCGTIVGLDQFTPINSFDLTLCGHPESFADLNIGGNQLANPGLWGGRVNGFHPWLWPDLIREPERLKRRTEWVMARLDQPILASLSLAETPDGSPFDWARESLRFLGQGDPFSITFEGFVRDSGHGLDRGDRPWSSTSTSRIAAARLAKWIERLVLSGQHILVDAPHLVARFPSLLPTGAVEDDGGPVVARGVSHDAIGLNAEGLTEARYGLTDWVSRPAWRWPMLVDNPAIQEVANPWNSSSPDWVFCEDVSRFLNENLTREFTSAVPSPFVTRYVVDREAAKEAGKPLFDVPFSVDDVAYEPSIQFAL